MLWVTLLVDSCLKNTRSQSTSAWRTARSVVQPSNHQTPETVVHLLEQRPHFVRYCPAPQDPNSEAVN